MAMKPLLLHAHAEGPNPIKIAIAMEYLGIPYQVKLWEFGDDPEKGVKGAAFTKINENGRLPALEDPNTGVVSWESGAVMNYIVRVYDKEGLLRPKDRSEQDAVDLEKWEFFLLTTLGPMTGQVIWFKEYHPVRNEDALNRYTEQVYRCYGVLESQLAKSQGESVIPGGITTADLHFEPWVRDGEYTKLSFEKYPNIQKWMKKMRNLEHFQNGYKRIADAAKQ